MARWHSCNVLEIRAGASRVWQFDARNGKFPLNREQTCRPGETLPGNLFAKNWRSLWQKKLNVAWLPPENVFIRVAQFPQSTHEETRAMVDLQLEKLSPVPITQAVWSMYILPHSSGNMQTVVVVIVTRSAVEEFLGTLEGQGYMADRLEVPLLDQLRAESITEDGAWVYPEAQGGVNNALVAWWYGGVLQNVDLISLPVGADRAASLGDQLRQMTWAGELEGWLTAPPRWHLVADPPISDEWEPALRQAVDQPVDIIAPLPLADVAALTASRAAQAEASTNLLPADFASRYQQQFRDRLWMRGLGAVLALYLVGLAVYFVAVGFLSYKTGTVEKQIALMGLNYTNALETKARFKILNDRQELKYAALDVYRSVAELMPDGLTLESLNFGDGHKVTLNGTAPADPGNMTIVIDFSSKLRKYMVMRPDSPTRPQPLYDSTAGEPLQQTVSQGVDRWTFGLELKRSDMR